MAATPQITLNPDVVYTRFDETSAALLNLKTKRYYTLNETGARIWEMVEGGEEISTVVRVLVEEFEVDTQQAEACVTDFLTDLRGEGLVGG
jgi:hypothetical protein